MKTIIFSCVHFLLQINWAANIHKSWDFSEDGAQAQLEAFLQDGKTSCIHTPTVFEGNNVNLNISSFSRCA